MKKRLFVLFLTGFILCLLAVCVSAVDTETYVYDRAELLTVGEIRSIEAKLGDIHKKYGVDATVYTVDTPEISYIYELPDDYAKNKFFELGRGGENGGIIIVVCMSTRDVMIYHHEVLSDSITDGMIDTVSPYLTDGEYADAFEAFADECDYYVNGELNGYPFKLGKNLLISVAVGFGIALLITGIMAGQLKTVKAQRAASNYVIDGSMNVTEARDIYLYSTVQRRKKPQNSSSSRSGGSSSGTSRGKF